MTFPILPARATYLRLENAAKRNALSIAVLRSLRDQLLKFNTSTSGRLLILPPFRSDIINELEKKHPEYEWLLDTEVWIRERTNLPNVIVLRSDGPVFSSGHDLKELKSLSKNEVKETFSICAEVMSLIRRSPAPVVGVIQGIEFL
jgi:enoyl-CoA hydratase/carnithine racemase